MSHGGYRPGSGAKRKPLCPRCKKNKKEVGRSYCQPCQRWINFSNYQKLIKGRPKSKAPEPRIIKGRKSPFAKVKKSKYKAVTNDFGSFNCSSNMALDRSLDRTFQ